MLRSILGLPGPPTLGVTVKRCIQLLAAAAGSNPIQGIWRTQRTTTINSRAGLCTTPSVSLLTRWCLDPAAEAESLDVTLTSEAPVTAWRAQSLASTVPGPGLRILALVWAETEHLTRPVTSDKLGLCSPHRPWLPPHQLIQSKINIRAGHS